MTQTQMLLARIERAIDDLQLKRADLDRTLQRAQGHPRANAWST